MCSVLVSIHRFKNELCYRCSVLVLAHGTTRPPEIPSESICVSNGSDGLYRTTFQPSSKYYLMTRLPVTQVDSTVLPVLLHD